MKSLTQHIAAVAGPSLLAVNISEALNLDIWDGADPSLVYLNGMILFIAGTFIASIHNRWGNASEILVTACGWLLVAAGAFRMVFPKAEQLHAGPWTYGFIGLLALVGIALCWVGFGRKSA
jgi:hypothetical protein